MPKCKICKKNKDTVERRTFSCYHEVRICCFECANIPICRCSGSEKGASATYIESMGECAFCMVYQGTILYKFLCGNVSCRRRLCNNCANEPKCSECSAFLLEEEREWPPSSTRQLS